MNWNGFNRKDYRINLTRLANSKWAREGFENLRNLIYMEDPIGNAGFFYLSEKTQATY
jgi:hypothetical protein